MQAEREQACIIPLKMVRPTNAGCLHAPGCARSPRMWHHHIHIPSDIRTLFYAPTRSRPGMRAPIAACPPVDAPASRPADAHRATSSGAHLDVMVLGCARVCVGMHVCRRLNRAWRRLGHARKTHHHRVSLKIYMSTYINTQAHTQANIVYGFNASHNTSQLCLSLRVRPLEWLAAPCLVTRFRHSPGTLHLHTQARIVKQVK